MGTFHGVVEYRLVQKMGWLGWQTTTSIIHNTKLMTIELSQINYNKLRKSVCHGITEVAHLVTGCPWHIRFPRPSVFLPKTSNPARTSWGGILKES